MSPDHSEPHADSLPEQLMQLRAAHRDLDEMIDRLQATPGHEELALKRLKKRKLQFKDAINRLESALIPDEPA